MFRRILVPLDGSDLAARAIEPALSLAQQSSGEVFFMRVPVLGRFFFPYEPGLPMLHPRQPAEDPENKIRAYLTNLQMTFKRPGIVIRCRVRYGEPAEAIVQTAAEEEADLIVMSSHGYSGIDRWLLGSVAEKVLAGAPCPITVIRSPGPLRRLLLPLDGSPASEQALVPALEFAAGLGLPVTLFRAVPVMSSGDVEELEKVERGFGYRLQDDLRLDAENYLNSLAAQHADRRLQIETAVGFEPAAESILNYAEAHQIDLIAMATHGRQGVQRWVYGSVTEKVLRGGPHSMFVVRPVAVAPAMATVRAERHPVPANKASITANAI